MADLRFTEDHVWVQLDDDDVAVVGISAYAAEQLGDIVYVELPSLGRDVVPGQELLVIESVKTTGEVSSPIGGTVAAINEALADTPELVNESPQEDGWLVKLEIDGDPDLSDLMDEDAYQEFIESL